MSELSPDVPRAAFDQQSEWYEETIAELRAKLARVTAERDELADCYNAAEDEVARITAERDAIRQATADEIEAEAAAAVANDQDWATVEFTGGMIHAAGIARRVGGGGGGGQ